MRCSLWERPRYAPLLQHVIFYAILLLCIPVLGTAQVNKWKDYDSVEHKFQIGAVGLLLPELGHDELLIDFSRFYAIDSFPKLRSITTAPANWKDRVDSTFWRQADAIGFKVIGPMGRIVLTGDGSEAIEHYGGYPGAIQNRCGHNDKCWISYNCTLRLEQ
jgi:hypothetical protein